MREFGHWLITNKVAIGAAFVIVLKWIYNAWTEGVTFPQFVRQFIGEIVQEAPTSFKLNASQVKLLAAHPEMHSEGHVIDASLTKADTNTA